MYKLRISLRAENEIKKISHPHQKAIILALTDIKEDPFLGKPLTRELTGRFSYRVGVYRIIYKVNKLFCAKSTEYPSEGKFDSARSFISVARPQGIRECSNKKDKTIDILTAGHRATIYG
jgi:mRNA interferase RelE/StbE